jgi:uncharacterized membrane protein
MSQLTNELRLLRLERRVERIERQLHIEPPPLEVPSALDRPITVRPDAEPICAATATVPPGPAPAPIAPVPSAHVAAPAVPVKPPPLPISHVPIARPQPSIPPIAPPSPQPLLSAAPLKPLAYERPAPPAPPARPRQLEQTIGLKWTGWFGAVVLVVGAALGVKYAYDQRWFGLIPAPVWMALIVTAGLALLGAGEYVYRKIHAIPAASLFGAGVATLFVASYVGYAYYGFYGAGVSMTLMAMATLIGAAVAMRGRLTSIAVLSLIGGNIAPMLVAQHNSPLVPFLCYLLMLQVVALFLAWWGGTSKWWTLRGLSLATTSLWTLGVMFSAHRGEWATVPFMLGYAALYHAELIASASRNRQAGGAGGAGRRAAPGVSFALLVTAALSMGLLCFFRNDTNATRATWVFGTSLVSAALGFVLPRIRAQLRPLAAAHRTAAAALLVLAVPIGFTGVRVEIGWLLLAVSFAILFATTRSPISRWAAPVTWVLVLMRILSAAGRQWGTLPISPDQVWLTLLGTQIGSATVMAWLASVAGHVIARLLMHGGDEDDATARDGWRVGALALSMIASLLGAGASVASLPALGASAAIILHAWLLIGADALAPKLRLSAQGAGLLILAAVKWTLIDTLANRFSPGWSATRYLPLLNPQMAIGAAITLSLIAIYFLRRRLSLGALRVDSSDGSARWTLSLAAVVIGLMTFGLTFEVERVIERAVAGGTDLAWPLWQAKHMAWTILWSVSLCSFILLATRLATDDSRRRRWLAGLWLLPALLTVKYVVVDTVLMRIGAGHASTTVAPLANLQLLAGLVVTGSLVFTRWLSGGLELRRTRSQLAMLVVFLIAWMGSMEIDRYVERAAMTAALATPAWHVKQLAWTIWWALVCGGAFALLRWRDPQASADEAWARLLPRALNLLAIKYLILDTTAWRLGHNPVTWPVMMNLEALAAAVVAGAMVLLVVLGLPMTAPQGRRDRLRGTCGALLVLCLLWCGTIEIDRAFHLPAFRVSVKDAALAEQVALSIFWAIFAVGSVIVGFGIRVSSMRYFGLALLALTLFKIVIIDLRGVDTGYRILSFLGLGLLLLGTSVLYGKVSPKLLKEPTIEAAA